jgi:hypothetical protein
LRGKFVYFPLNPLRSSRDPLVTKLALKGGPITVPKLAGLG